VRLERRTSVKATAWRWLIVGHRWLGIATCLLFAMWFASGLVMLYVAFPELTREERVSRLQRIDWSQVRIAPERVLHGLALGEFPRDFRLEMMAGEPVYRVDARGLSRQTLSAVTGRIIEHVDERQALAIVRNATSTPPATVATIERDQWTVAGTFDGHRPLHRVALNDDAGAELYVSSRTGEIVLDSDARERGWNWFGAVIHWLYFRDLRANPPLWSQVVMWISGVGIVVAVSGLWLGVDRLRLKRRNRERSMTPFRGWMAWHHIAGVIGGVLVLTWIFSGWLSMGPPVPWEREFDPKPRAAATAALAGNNEPDFPARLEILQQLAGADVREASFMWALGKPQIVLADQIGRTRVIDALTGHDRVLGENELASQASGLFANARLVATERLVEEDAYWYSRRADVTLPVLRFKFDDVDQTWAHVDPRTGRLVGWLRASDRIHRWLFNSLHSFDFAWLLKSPPAWDVLMWTLSLAGLSISVSSIVIGWRRLRRSRSRENGAV
jgi:hypothetical protein